MCYSILASPWIFGGVKSILSYVPNLSAVSHQNLRDKSLPEVIRVLGVGVSM